MSDQARISGSAKSALSTSSSSMQRTESSSAVNQSARHATDCARRENFRAAQNDQSLRGEIVIVTCEEMTQFTNAHPLSGAA